MKLRPRYKFILDNIDSQEAARIVFKKSMELSPELEVKKSKNVIHFYIPKKERKLWSPYLSVTFEGSEEGVIVRGNIGPSEKIWLPFIFLFGCLITSILFLTIYSFVQLNLGHTTNAFPLLIPLILCLGGLYLFSFLGQRKSSHCIFIFHNLLHRTFGNTKIPLSFEIK